MAVCLCKLGAYQDSLKVIDLAMKHYHDFYRKFTSHVDIARTFSPIACAYHELAKRVAAHIAPIDGSDRE